MSETTTYTVHYDNGSSLTMPSSRELAVGDTWRDTIAEWKAIRMGTPTPDAAVDVWVEPVRD
jgi:hypothetical protein